MKLWTIGTLIVSCVALSGCNPFDSELTKVCEDLLKDRLRSPSGYKRIEISHYSKPVDLKKFEADELKRISAMKGDKKQSRREELDFDLRRYKENPPTSFEKYITYDAPNAYGTLIRGTAHCEYISDNGGEGDVFKYRVKLNGKTMTEWMIDSIKG